VNAAQRGLDEALGLAVGFQRVRPGADAREVIHRGMMRPRSELHLKKPAPSAQDAAPEPTNA